MSTNSAEYSKRYRERHQEELREKRRFRYQMTKETSMWQNNAQKRKEKRRSFYNENYKSTGWVKMFPGLIERRHKPANAEMTDYTISAEDNELLKRIG